MSVLKRTQQGKLEMTELRLVLEFNFRFYYPNLHMHKMKQVIIEYLIFSVRHKSVYTYNTAWGYTWDFYSSLK